MNNIATTTITITITITRLMEDVMSGIIFETRKHETTNEGNRYFGRVFGNCSNRVTLMIEDGLIEYLGDI